MQYTSEIRLGAKYRDLQTGVEGIAVVISFHQHSCERVVIETKADESNDIKFYEFDSVRLDKISDGFAKPLPPLPDEPGVVHQQHEPTRATGATPTASLRRTGRRQS